MRKQNNNQNKKKIQSLFICCQSNLKHYILIDGNNGEFFVFLRKKRCVKFMVANFQMLSTTQPTSAKSTMEETSVKLLILLKLTKNKHSLECCLLVMMMRCNGIKEFVIQQLAHPKQFKCYH
jgi:hypothetical protein